MTNALRTLFHDARFQALRRLGFLALILAVSWLAFSPNPPKQLDTGWDKSNHLLAFSCLLIALRLGWPRLGWVQAALLMLGYGVFIELVQSQIPGREAKLDDLVADAIGIALGMAIHRLLPKRPGLPTAS